MCSRRKSNHYGVNVNVLEGRDLVTNVEHIVVRVMIDSQKRYTHSRSIGSSPHFDEYFLFEFNCTLEELLNKTIRFTVMEPKKRFRSRKTIGEVHLDVALIWDQPNHIFYHKWTMLTKVQGGNSFLKGYLKIDLSISTKGTIPQIPKDEPDTEDIEGNLLLYNTPTGDYQKALYSFNIYLVEDLMKVSSSCHGRDVFVEIYFLGSKIKTSNRRMTDLVEWNEQINFYGLFPPLYQRIRFEFRDSLFQKHLATFFLNLRDISNDGEEGFLPTFGPNYVYLYNEMNEYHGRFLTSVETKTTFQDYGSKDSCFIKPISPINIENFWKNEEVFALCIIMDVNCIDWNYISHSIDFEISVGRKKKEEVTNKISLSPIHKKNNNFINLDETKPCIYTKIILPNLQIRMFHRNALEKIYESFSENLYEVELLIFNDETTSVLQSRFYKTLNEFEKIVGDYLNLNMQCTATNLDVKKSQFCIDTLKFLLGKSKSMHEEKFSRKNFRKAKMMQEKIKILINQMQGCWPDYILWMHHSSRKVACFRIPCNEICDCNNPAGKGKYCAVKRTIFMQTISGPPSTVEIPFKFVAKLEIISWIGLFSDRYKCLKELKNLFQETNTAKSESHFPHFLESRERNNFQFRAHIYEGRFIPGADKSGLSDPYLLVILNSLIQETKTVGATLNPVWKLTLNFGNLVFWGTPEYILQNPPLVFIVAFDNDKCGDELQGRALVKASIILKTGEYKPEKLHWIKITNRGHETGEIFAAFELIQINPEEGNKSLAKGKTEIPKELLPNLINHRVEIMFWGVRRLKEICGCILTRPKIVVNISNMNIHSTPITNPRQCLNFSNPYVVTDMKLPLEKEYSPTLCIQLQDCKSFGRNTYIGVATSNIKNFYYTPRSQSQYKLLREKPVNLIRLKKYESDHQSTETKKKSWKCRDFRMWLRNHMFRCHKKKFKNYEVINQNEKKEDETVDLDWWSKYHASVEGGSSMALSDKEITTIKVFGSFNE